jgi:glycosyltransferase involved in cell wall biosynthesis
MMDSSITPRARLFTVFGTVLYVDADSGRLRHGPVETSPANAVFVAEPGSRQPHRKGMLMIYNDGSLEPIICLLDHCRTVSSTKKSGNWAAGTLLELISLERGLVALTAQDLFLTAEPGGAVSLSRPVCSTWECFLASEDCYSGGADDVQLLLTANAKFDRRTIQSYLVHPLNRKNANAKSTATKVLIFGYTKWSHGRVYYDLSKQFYRRGYIVDIINWREDQSSCFADLIPLYDLFMTALDGVGTLTDIYRVPYEKVIALSHSEMDIRMLIEQKGTEVFEKFAGYGVVSECVYCASLMKGVTRIPKVVPLGVDFAEFYSEISERLATVGYAGSMSLETYGVELKRGELAEVAAREAGLDFKVAGSTRNQIWYLDMPDFYRSVDAVLNSSISESAGLPVMEAAAAGKLVIGTPVGHFPRKAYEGGGILAPIEAGKFKAFTVDTLRYFKDNPAAYRDKCHAIQEAARKFDWKYTIDAWVDLIEASQRRGASKTIDQPDRRKGFGQRHERPEG